MSGQSPSKSFDKRAVLSAHPFFRDLRSSVIERIVLHAITRRVKKGTVLFRKGDAGTNLYAVCSGAVRISAPSRQGHEAIFNLIPSGEIFGEIALLDAGPRTADAVMIEDGELMVIERRDLIPLLQDNPDVAMKIIEIVCGRLRRTSEQVEDIIFLGLPNRLAKALLQLGGQPASKPNGKVRITQLELSQIVGVSRESVNKLLRDWQRRKWLKLERGGVIILAPTALAEVVSEAT